MTGRVKLATCSYAEFAPTMGAPVRTTLGAGRRPLPYRLVGHARLITPTRTLLDLAHAGKKGLYRDMYEKRLVETGAVRIAAELTEIAQQVPGQRLVLLCFDQLGRGPGEWCHRTMFAAWWEEQTGEEVPELGAVTPSPPPTLF
ncbi:hypothetical protein ACWFMI_23645 [Nocardiopsis terrae]|uniref:hypothetical protein n=1 Tax=Streptomyces sp. NPDC057554 TaxID=3350538 RepID=UPI0036CD7A26